MNRRNLVAGMAVLSVSTIAWTAHGRFIPRSCQACDEDRCSNPDMLYFGSLGDPDYLAACGQPHCCILATGATCADALGCPPDDDFDYDTVDEIASDLAVMEPESVVRLLRENPEHVEYFAMRRAVVVKGCGGALKAVLPLMEKQVAALEAADL